MMVQAASLGRIDEQAPVNQLPPKRGEPLAAGVPRPRRVAIVGAGITGLAAAHRLRELDESAEITVLEASTRAGGVIHTLRADGFLAETGPDNFITNPQMATNLCTRLGLADELIPVEAGARTAYVVSRGKLERIPAGFALMAPRRAAPLLASPLLSWPGKLRVLAEPLVPPRTDDADESLGDFARRRLGREAFERLVQPLVAGIYTADPEKLSMRAALRRFYDFERRDGSLLRGLSREARASGSAAKPSAAAQSSSGARYNLFVTLRGGLETLVEKLVNRLPAGTLRLASLVTSIDRATDADVMSSATSTAAGPQWRLTWRATDTHLEHRETFDDLVLALPAPRCGELFAPMAPVLADELRNIEYAGSAVVLAGYRREQIAHALDASGFVVPAIEGRRILACSFSSAKYRNRAPQGHVLLRVFVGGASDPSAVELPDAELRKIVTNELGELIGLRGEPAYWHVARWRRSMPQYHLGHCERVARIEALAAELPRLALAGNAFGGVGIPACIASGEAAAERLFAPPNREA